MLSGCWDAKELDDLSIPLVAACDAVLEGEKKYPDDKYLVSVGVPIFYKDAEKKFRIVENTGRIIGETRGRRSSELGEPVIFGQLQVVLIGEELAKKENLLEVTDIFYRNPVIKASAFLVIVHGRAADLIKKPISYYPNVGIYLKALLDSSKKTNFYPYTTLFHFNRDLISYETAVLVPHIIYKDGEIVLAGSCLVNKGKMFTELGREETETVVMLRGIKCHGTLAFNVLNGKKANDEAAFECKNSRKVTVKRIGEKYIFDIQIKLEGVIAEHESQEPTQDGTDYLKIFQYSLEESIKKRAEAFVKKTKEEFKFDALNLANYIKAHTREKLAKEDIDRIIQESEINVEVKVQLRNTGGLM